MNKFQHYIEQFRSVYPRAFQRLMAVVFRTHTNLLSWMRANPQLGREFLEFLTSEFDAPADEQPTSIGGELPSLQLGRGKLELNRPTLQLGIGNLQDQIQRNAQAGGIDSVSDEELARELKRRHFGEQDIFILRPMPVSSTNNPVDYEKWVVENILSSDEWDVDGELMNAYRVYQYIKKFPRSAGRVAGVVADLAEQARNAA